MRKIAIEEHFWTQEYVRFLRSNKGYPRLETCRDETHGEIERLWHAPDLKAVLDPDRIRKLLDLGEGRLKEMDETGIDMQLLSISAPGVEVLDVRSGTEMAKKINDDLSCLVKEYPERFAGLATFAPQDPRAAADEIDRAVTELGLRGAKITSNINGEYLDHEKFGVILEKLEQLGVPLYLHPRRPAPDMLKPYLTYPALSGSMWGFAAETSLQAMRLICSGVFDQYPGLKIILGHLGEAIPFWLWRIDNRWRRQELGFDPLVSKLKKTPSQYFMDNFYVTTSGMFWSPVLLFTCMVLGADRILFAVDYPHEANEEAVEFIEQVPICESDKEKICFRNAEKLFGLS
jgi:2,3-dihydroxybenzoate decarboxylase